MKIKRVVELQLDEYNITVSETEALQLLADLKTVFEPVPTPTPAPAAEWAIADSNLDIYTKEFQPGPNFVSDTAGLCTVSGTKIQSPEEWDALHPTTGYRGPIIAGGSVVDDNRGKPTS